MSTVDLTPTVDVRRAEDRFSSQFGWLDSKHSFSFGHHYDPANTHHGLLLVNNDDVVDPGTGFETHPHRDMEIVTWVLAAPSSTRTPPATTGHLPGPGAADERRHRDPALGEERLLAPDRRHATATRCTSCRCGSCPTRPASRPATSSWRSTTSCCAAGSSRSPPGMDKHDGESAIRIKNKYAALYAARLQPGQSRAAARGAVPAPVRPPRRRHPRGRRPAGHGDAVRFTATGGQRVTATEPAEILVWEMHATVAA